MCGAQSETRIHSLERASASAAMSAQVHVFALTTARIGMLTRNAFVRNRLREERRGGARDEAQGGTSPNPKEARGLVHQIYRTLAKMMSEGKNNILARSWERRGTGTVVPRVAACILSFSSPAILKRPRGDQAVV
jgi:hypothetical protein